MPPDNAAPVFPGASVAFPEDGPSNNTIVRIGAGAFQLPSVGIYRVAFSVSFDEAGQLELTLNGVSLPYTVSGRATGTSQVSEEVLITTTTANAVLRVVNPPGNVVPLTITPLAGGTNPVGASLLIERVA